MNEEIKRKLKKASSYYSDAYIDPTSTAIQGESPSGRFSKISPLASFLKKKSGTEAENYINPYILKVPGNGFCYLNATFAGIIWSCVGDKEKLIKFANDLTGYANGLAQGGIGGVKILGVAEALKEAAGDNKKNFTHEDAYRLIHQDSGVVLGLAEAFGMPFVSKGLAKQVKYLGESGPNSFCSSSGIAPMAMISVVNELLNSSEQDLNRFKFTGSEEESIKNLKAHRIEIADPDILESVISSLKSIEECHLAVAGNRAPNNIEQSITNEMDSFIEGFGYKTISIIHENLHGNPVTKKEDLTRSITRARDTNKEPIYLRAGSGHYDLLISETDLEESFKKLYGSQIKNSADLNKEHENLNQISNSIYHNFMISELALEDKFDRVKQCLEGARGAAYLVLPEDTEGKFLKDCAKFLSTQQEFAHKPLLTKIHTPQNFKDDEFTDYDARSYSQYVFSQKYPQSGAFADYASVGAKNEKITSSKMAETIKAGKWGFFHYSTGGHWRMVVISPDCEVACLDSLKSGLDERIIRDVTDGFANTDKEMVGDIKYCSLGTQIGAQCGLHSCLAMEEVVKSICEAAAKRQTTESLWKMKAMKILADFEISAKGDINKRDLILLKKFYEAEGCAQFLGEEQQNLLIKVTKNEIFTEDDRVQFCKMKVALEESYKEEMKDFNKNVGFKVENILQKAANDNDPIRKKPTDKEIVTARINAAAVQLKDYRKNALDLFVEDEDMRKNSATIGANEILQDIGCFEESMYCNASVASDPVSNAVKEVLLDSFKEKNESKKNEESEKKIRRDGALIAVKDAIAKINATDDQKNILCWKSLSIPRRAALIEAYKERFSAEITEDRAKELENLKKEKLSKGVIASEESEKLANNLIEFALKKLQEEEGKNKYFISCHKDEIYKKKTSFYGNSLGYEGEYRKSFKEAKNSKEIKAEIIKNTKESLSAITTPRSNRPEKLREVVKKIIEANRGGDSSVVGRS